MSKPSSRICCLAAASLGIAALSGCGGSLDPTLAEGKQLYEKSCASCHLPTGAGKTGVGPALAGSDWVTGSPQRLTRISLYGVRGPIEVRGQQFNLEMPGVFYYQFDDAQMAAVLTYIRQAWGNNAAPIGPESVAQIRAAEGERDSWTVEELAASEVTPGD